MKLSLSSFFALFCSLMILTLYALWIGPGLESAAILVSVLFFSITMHDIHHQTLEISFLHSHNLCVIEVEE